jgi:hypothetical protein
VLRGWARFWFSKADPTTLGLMRICCGLVVLYAHLTYGWGLLGYVGPEAWIDRSEADFAQREVPVFSPTLRWGDGLRQIGRGNYFWSVYYEVTDPGWVVAWHVFFLCWMLLFAVGLWTRLSGALAWAGAMCYVQRASSTVFGLDTMMMIALLYLNVGPSGAALSLDRWLQKRRARRLGQPEPAVEPSRAANFATRLTQVHFCIIYLAAGSSKLLGTTWWDGTALSLVVLNPGLAPLDNALYYRALKLLAGHRLLWELCMTAGVAYTLFVEIGFAFLVWDRRTRWLMLSGSVLLHGGIGLCMGLTTFSLMMMVLVLSFVLPVQARAVVRGAGELYARLSAARAAAPGFR